MRDVSRPGRSEVAEIERVGEVGSPQLTGDALAKLIRRGEPRSEPLPVAVTSLPLRRGFAAGLLLGVEVNAGSWKPAEPFPDFDAALMRAAAESGALRLGVLARVADGTPLAAQYWIIDQGGARATVPKLFHLESERAASPGTVLTAMMVRHLIAEDRVRTLDFGRGDDAYKALWVSRRVQLIGLVLADPRHPAGLAALARQAAGGLLRRLRGR